MLSNERIIAKGLGIQTLYQDPAEQSPALGY